MRFVRRWAVSSDAHGRPRRIRRLPSPVSEQDAVHHLHLVPAHRDDPLDEVLPGTKRRAVSCRDLAQRGRGLEQHDVPDIEPGRTPRRSGRSGVWTSPVDEHDIAATHPGRHRLGRDRRQRDDVVGKDERDGEPKRTRARRDPRRPRELVSNGSELRERNAHFARAPRRPRRVPHRRAQLPAGRVRERRCPRGVARRGRHVHLLAGAAVAKEQPDDLVPLAGVEAERFERAPRDRDAAHLHRRRRAPRVLGALRRALRVPAAEPG